MNNNKITSEQIATEAARTLHDPSASATAKALAGSALSQRSPSNQTGKEVEDLASKVLQSTKYSANTKSLAGSVLSQANKSR